MTDLHITYAIISNPFTLFSNPSIVILYTPYQWFRMKFSKALHVYQDLTVLLGFSINIEKLIFNIDFSMPITNMYINQTE